jgi:hypothetical protein
MNIEKLMAKAQQVQEQAAITAETAKSTLSEDTKKLIQRARWHHDKVPYTDLPDTICMFRVTYVTFYQNTFVAQGVIWPYKKLSKAANFLFLAEGRQAHYNISDVMEQCSNNFRQKRQVYRIQKKLNKAVEYPYWIGPVQDALIDKTFIVKAHHYNGQLQLDFATWRFQQEIAELEADIQLHKYYK